RRVSSGAHDAGWGSAGRDLGGWNGERAGATPVARGGVGAIGDGDRRRRAGRRAFRMTKPRFASVVLDVDSTVSGIEGIDWLARRRGGDIATNVARGTADAMRGAIPLEEGSGPRGAPRLDSAREGLRPAAAPHPADAC